MNVFCCNNILEQSVANHLESMEIDKTRDDTLVVCKDCGKDVPEDWRFCIMCGAQLAVENQLTPNQQFKSEANTPQHVDEQSVETEVDSTIELVTSNLTGDTEAVVAGYTTEVTPIDIKESAEGIEEQSKPLASPTTPGQTGDSGSVKFTTVSLYVCRKRGRKYTVKCG